MKDKEIDLNNISNVSGWSARLLGLTPFKEPIRNISKIDSEYDKDKYAKLLKYYNQNKSISYIDLRKYEMFNKIINGKIYYSKRDKIYESCFNNVQSILNKMFVNDFKSNIKKVDTVIELGCGWGYNLKMLHNNFKDINYIGGEYSNNAVTLGNKLFSKDNIKLEKFNYYDKSWKIFDNVDKALVFTSHSIEQLPSFKKAFKTLSKYKDKIELVINYEPVTEMYPDSLIDEMRIKYSRMNDYNQDLYSTLDENNVKVIKIKPKCLGINPYNPSTMIQWKFRQ